MRHRHRWNCLQTQKLAQRELYISLYKHTQMKRVYYLLLFIVGGHTFPSTHELRSCAFPFVRGSWQFRRRRYTVWLNFVNQPLVVFGQNKRQKSERIININNLNYAISRLIGRFVERAACASSYVQHTMIMLWRRFVRVWLDTPPQSGGAGHYVPFGACVLLLSLRMTFYCSSSIL